MMELCYDYTWPLLKDQLTYMLDVDGELLVKLYRNGVLSDKQFWNLQKEKDYTSKTVQVLDYFASTTSEQQSKFFEALNETNQGHITNYVRSNGQRSSDYADNWPLYDTSQWNKIKNNLVELIELTDSYHGLLDGMVQAKCFSYQQGQDIGNRKERSERNGKLFEVLRQRSVTAYWRFIDCLLYTNQHHVASLLEPEKAGDTTPLAFDCKCRLMDNYSALIKLMEIEHGLLELMRQQDCLTSRQIEAIKAIPTKTDGVILLLDILIRGSQESFDHFKRCLLINNQKHVHKLLQNNVICAEIDAHSSGLENNEEIERRLVEKIKNELSSRTPDGKKRVVQELYDWLKSHDVELLSSQTQHSIRIYFICRSLAGVQYLADAYHSDTLRSNVQKLFRSLLEDRVNLVVKKLDWKEPNYSHCLKYFVTDTSHQCLSADVENRMAEEPATLASVNSDDDVTHCPICTEVFDNPRSLPCLHTYCHKCLGDLWSDFDPGDLVGCPLCRMDCAIPADGITGFVHNVFIQRIVDSSKVSDNVACEACVTDAGGGITVAATKYCMDCHERLCDSCCKTHRELTSGPHLINELEVEREKLAASCCTVHKTKPIELYCFDCKCNICTECFAVKHQLHKCQEVEKAASDVMCQIAADIAAVQLRIDETARQELQQKSVVKSFLDQVTSVANEIDRRCSDIKFFIDYEKQLLLKDLQTVKEEAVKEFEQFEERTHWSNVAMRSFVTYSKELNNKGLAHDVTREGGSIHNRASEILTAYPVHDVHCGSGVAFEAASVYDVLASSETCNFVGKLVNTETAGGAGQSSCMEVRSFAADLVHAKEQLVCNKQLLLGKDETISELKRLLRENGEKLTKAENEMKQQEVIAQLSSESHLPASTEKARQRKGYLSRPTAGIGEQAVGASEDGTRCVTGVAVHGNELFVVRSRPAGFMEIYSATTCEYLRKIEVPYLDDDFCHVNGLTSCDANNCLYVSSWHWLQSLGSIVKVELAGDSQVVQWSVDDVPPQGLSVNSEHNLIVTCWCLPSKLLEYTTFGELVREISLPDDVICPWQAIQLSRDRFLVSHGYRSKLQQVSVVHKDGRVLLSYESKPGPGNRRWKAPRLLAADRNGFIFVADKINNRIVVLDSWLQWSHELQIYGSSLNFPHSLYLDEQNCQLFVIESKQESPFAIVSM